MTARKVTETRTAERWIDDCKECGKPYGVSAPGSYGSTDEDGRCLDCKRRAAEAKCRADNAHLIGATIVEIEVDGNSCSADVSALIIDTARGRMRVEATADYDGGADLVIEKAEVPR